MLKKKGSILLSILCVILILLTACSAEEKGTVVTCDGYDITLGKTTVAELKKAGFTNDYSHVDGQKIESMASNVFYAMKDDVSYGFMYAVNKSASPIEFEKCVLREVTLSYDSSEYPIGEVLVNGVNFEGYTKEEIKEAMGDATITSDDDTYLVFESGDSYYYFFFDNGSETLTKLWVIIDLSHN
ncbi:MAG: hypothetical protein K2N89_05765 [Lachnospiraceae bacterium]|nr:hypothetical protein [Lachnospiraceae bacterium]